MSRPGAMGNVQPANEDAHAVLNSVKGALEAAAGRAFPDLHAVEFGTQLVNGVNFFIRAVCGSEHVFVRAHRAFNGTTTLHSHQAGKTEADALTFF